MQRFLFYISAIFGGGFCVAFCSDGLLWLIPMFPLTATLYGGSVSMAGIVFSLFLKFILLLAVFLQASLLVVPKRHNSLIPSGMLLSIPWFNCFHLRRWHMFHLYHGGMGPCLFLLLWQRAGICEHSPVGNSHSFLISNYSFTELLCSY